MGDVVDLERRLSEKIAKPFKTQTDQIRGQLCDLALAYVQQFHPNLLQQGTTMMRVAVTVMAADFAQLLADGARDAAIDALGSEEALDAFLDQMRST